MAHQYNSPPGTASDIGTQMNTFYWHKKALVEAKKEMYFMPLADVMSMPKHFGKEIRVYHYIPLLDDRNISDQGIDAAGATLVATQSTVTFSNAIIPIANAAKAAAVTAINANVGTTLVATAGADDSGGTGFANLTLVGSLSATYTNANAATVEGLNLGAVVEVNYGNLYGSSKDVGTITGKLPTLTETGGRVNRVGFTRLERTGTIAKFGFFTEFTQESFDFDSDSDLYGHLSREMVTGATQLTEAALQADLLAAAGLVMYGGAATQDSEITAEGATPSIVDYDDLMRLSIALDENRTPKQTKVISGSRMIDTKTINNGRVMYIGTELQMLVMKMEDSFGDAAFIPINQYADAGTIMNGEIGSVGQFRIVVVPEMLSWGGAGAVVGTNPGYRESGNRYDVYPMLVVGDGSFTTIGFQTDGKTVKFKITTKMPGKETADRNDPYGEMGFSSIKWYYGTMILRPERLALIKTVAPQ